MKQYLDLLSKVYFEGTERNDRTGTGTRAIFGPQLEFDLRKGFPAVTTKRLWLKGVWVELLWLISGSESAKQMLKQDVHIWDEWMSDDKELGRVYGVQWRSWRKHRMDNLLDSTLVEHIDQLAECIHKIKKTPHDRRLIVSAWNPGELDEMALPPCHILFQFFVDGPWLDIKVYQRSADMFLGLPFDIASYATLLTMIAQVTGKKPRMLYYTLGDTHIYNDHVEQVREQLTRLPYPLPTLILNPNITSIDDFELGDIDIVGYQHHPGIKADVSK